MEKNFIQLRNLLYNSVMIKIGSETIDTNIFLAPLAGCSDLSFRLISREEGARFCFYEMVDANSLVRRNGGNGEILKRHPKDSPIAAQLLGSDPSMMEDAAQRLMRRVDIAFLDVNCACPAKKVIKKRAGAYLLRDPDALCKILRRLVSSLPVPLTVKIRIGYDKIDRPAIADIARRCEGSGAAAIFVHGRLTTQGYAGEIDYDSIRAVKEAAKIPVFGSGNIFGPESAKKMLVSTGCDGIIAARGALGNPWIFRDIEEYLANGVLPEKREMRFKLEMLRKHISYINEYKEIRPSSKIGVMRKVALWYVKNFSESREMRRRISGVKSYDEMLSILSRISLEGLYRKDALV